MLALYAMNAIIGNSQPRTNTQLIKDIKTRLEKLTNNNVSIQWHWIKGHSQVIWNDLVDALSKTQALTQSNPLSQKQPPIPTQTQYHYLTPYSTLRTAYDIQQSSVKRKRNLKQMQQPTLNIYTHCLSYTPN